MIPSVKCSLGNMLSHGCPVCILLCACNIRRYSSAQYICSKTSNDVSTIQLAQWNSSLCSETQTFLSSYNSTLILYRTTLKVIAGGGSVLLIVIVLQHASVVKVTGANPTAPHCLLNLRALYHRSSN